ncbi:hypothetical protein HD806DRAFT_503161 [Xylariaceae sp. AK1471]|nr:hypothetical protein HD806DRAFT_503161 [Xylariaceae sp. AK1471]
MDVISSTAAVTQLLAQAINLWQQVQVAYQSVKAAPKVLADTAAQLSNLSDIILEIEREPELRTPEIHAQMKIIKFIATELCQRLQVMAALQRKSALRQGLRAWSRGPRDEAKLADILQRLEHARTNLILRINLVQVSLTGGIAEDIGRFVQGAEGVIQAQTKRQDTRHRLLIQSNEVKGDGDQVNGIIGVEDSWRPTSAKIRDNIALGRQRNFIAGRGSLKIIHGLDS